MLSQELGAQRIVLLRNLSVSHCMSILKTGREGAPWRRPHVAYHSRPLLSIEYLREPRLCRNRFQRPAPGVPELLLRVSTFSAVWAVHGLSQSSKARHHRFVNLARQNHVIELHSRIELDRACRPGKDQRPCCLSPPPSCSTRCRMPTLQD